MPINSFSVGRDVTLDVIGPNGPLFFEIIVDFQCKPDTTDAKVTGMNGIVNHQIFQNGWSGSFSIERKNSVVDDYFAQIEANYYAGLNLLPASITQTIQEASGAISQYRFQLVVLKLDDAGTWAGDKTVKQKVGFMAARRIKVA